MVNQKVKEPVVAGSWYPGEKSGLEKITGGYLGKVKVEVSKKVRGLIVPHAGYQYSGQVAAVGFKQLENFKEGYKTVIVIAPSHHVMLDKAAVLDVDYYKTPLGKIKISGKVKKLLKEDLIEEIEEAFEQEHSLEMELPFLQAELKKFELIPMIVGDVEPGELAKVLKKYIDEETLIVASSDLSHFHSYEEAVKLDRECIKAIEEMNFEKAAKCEACGIIPILTLMEIAKERGWKGEVLKYANSGDVTGDKSSVVGYMSIAFVEGSGLKKEEKEILLKLARGKLESLYGGKEVEIPKLSSNLKEVRGCFVTLTKNNQLRGCIGNIIGVKELYECVLANVENAALNDSRFDPVSEEELKDIKIEISVLSRPKKLEFKNSEELLEKLRPGIDGVVLKKGVLESTFLPQVWEQIRNKVDFLESLCLKAGLDKDEWKANVEIYVYEVEKFSE